MICTQVVPMAVPIYCTHLRQRSHAVPTLYPPSLRRGYMGTERWKESEHGFHI